METVNLAVDSVLSTPELLGLILTPLCFDDLLEISLVSKFWHAAILSTPATQRTLLILPSKAFISNPQRLNRVSYSYCYSPLNSYLVWSFPLHDVPNPFFVSDPLFHCIVAPGQPHSPYHQYGCLVPSRSDFGPYTKFPFKSQSRSWRDMLVLESPKELMIKTLTIEETVKFRSPGWHRSRLGSWEWRWAENDDWKWVRNKTVVFGDGLRCGDVWDLVRGKKDEIGGDRVFSLFCRWRMEGVECRERKDTVVGLSAQIRVDAWYATTWKAWLRCLCGGDRENRKTRTWREWFRSLVGARKRVDGKVTNRSGPFFGEHYLYRMKNNEDAVLEVIIVKTCSRWKIWRWFRPWKKTNSAQLEKLGFVREADPLIRILNF